MEFNGICPWCGGDRLYWNSEKNVYVCFSGSCDRRGRGKPPVQVWLSAHEERENGNQTVTLPEGTEPLHTTIRSRCDLRIRRYLKSHRVHLRDAVRFGLMQTEESLVIPFYNPEGELTYYQERKVFGPKMFRNAPVEKGDLMFFTDRSASHVIFVESAVSALRVHRVAGPCAAFLGKPSREQIRRLHRASRKSSVHRLKSACILLDSDAYASAVDVYRQLAGWLCLSLALLPYGDPCDVSDRLLRKVLQSEKTQRV